MKCPTCAAWSGVLETRQQPDNTTRRRHRCANNCPPFWTVQVLEATYTAAKHRNRAVQATNARRQAQRKRDECIRAWFAAGESRDVIGARFGITASRVWQIVTAGGVVSSTLGGVERQGAGG